MAGRSSWPSILVKMSNQLIYKPAPTVRKFMKNDDFVRVIVGPIGSGKSSGCVVELLRRAQKQKPGPDGKRRSRWAVIRNTYRQLKDTTRKTFEQWIPYGEPWARWREQDFIYEIKHPRLDIECEILFRALDRPDDVKKVLSLELTGAYFNEVREIPKEIFDGIQGRVGRYPSRAQGGATWFGVWADTNPWHVSHWGYRLFSEALPSGFALFEQPGGRTPQAENVENLPPGYYDRLCYGKDQEWIESYVDGKYPASAQGSVYGRSLAELEKRGGMLPFDHPNDGVFVSWDLGISDATAAIFWRVNRDGIADIIDHYEASGEPLSHFFAMVDARGYEYVKHFLPHDARQRSFQTGVTVEDQFRAKYGAGKIAITPSLSLTDGIAAGRWLLEQKLRIHPRCEKGIEALRGYRYDWDEERQVFSRNPIHDWTSHTADAFRYLALAVKHSEVMTRPPEPKKEPEFRPPTLDEVWEAQERAPAKERW
jgi:hypothetical protein